MEITLLKSDDNNNNDDEEEQDNEVLLIKTRKLSISKARRHIEKSFVKLSAKIPRHIISIDEKYLRHCLELIYVTASLNNPSWEPISSKMPDFPVMTNNLPMIRGHENGEWIVGSITRSRSIMNILKSPFYHRDEAKSIRFDSDRIPITKSRVSEMKMGMVQLTWKAGSPHCVFLLEGRSLTYMAKRTSDSVYVFFSESDIIVGRMRVSQTNSDIKETEFVLFGVDDDNPIINVSKTQIFKKKHNNGLQKKITSVFKTHWSSQQSYQDSCVWPRHDNYFVPNLQLIAVVVKEQINTRQQEEETRGWGLKFLRRTKKINKEESLSIDIVIADGIHGGPRKKEGGPSGLLERWRSDGKCDCEGWDMGCSFKVFETRPTEIGSSSSSFDLFIQGSSESSAVTASIKIAKEDDSSYVTHFESGISALQTFATAVAIIHCRSPQLKTQQDQDF